MAEFKVKGHEYVSEKIPAYTQFHVARRLAPIFSTISKAYKESQAAGEIDLQTFIGPVAEALAELKDEDCDYIFNVCMAVTKRKNAGAISAVKVGNTFMFSDIGMPELVEISYHVLQDNLGNFLNGQSGPTSTGEKPA